MPRKAANKNELLDCRQVDALLGAYLEGGLSPEQEAVVQAHLNDCLTCRQAAIQDAELVNRLRMETAWQQQSLSPAAAARVQERVYQRMRRRIVARRVSRLAWGVVGALLLTLMISGIHAYWQWKVQNVRRPTPTAKPATVPPEEKQTVVITFACSELDYPAYERLAQTFTETNPDIEIRLLSLTSLLAGYGDDEALARIVAAADAAASWLTPVETRQGLLLDLTPFVQSDGDFDPDDFYPLAWDAYRWDGGTWALPSTLGFAFLFYDRAAFDAMELAYPATGWNWQDLRRAAVALTVWEGDRVVRYGFVGNMPGAAAVVAQSLAGSLWDTVEGRPVPDLLHPAVTDALRWYVNLALTDGIMPVTGDYIELGELVEVGQAAMWLGTPEQYPRIARDMDVGIALLPQSSTPLLARGYFVSAGTAHPQESWRWIEFLTRQIVNPDEPLSWPARRSIAAVNSYSELLAAEVGSEMQTAYEYSLARATLMPDRSVWQPLDEALVEVLTGETSLETALTNAQRQIEQALRIAVTVSPQTPLPVATLPPAQEKVTFVPLANEELYTSLAETFNASRTGDRIKVDTLPFEGRYDHARLAQEFDCFAFPVSTSTPPGEMGLLDLEPYTSADPNFRLDDYYSFLLDTCRDREGTWCLPFDARLKLLYYDRRLFDRAELPYPALDWRTTDFLEAARTLTAGQGNDKQLGFVPFTDEFFEFLSFIARDGALLFDTPDASGAVRPSFDGPTVVAALRRYADLRTTDGAMPPIVLSQWGGASDRDWAQYGQVILEGRAAMWTKCAGDKYFYSSRTLPANFPLGVAPLPGGSGHADYGWVIAYFISDQTSYPDICWEWIVFLGDYLETVEGLPARRSLAGSTELEAKVGAEIARTYRAVLENGVAVGHPIAFPQGYEWASPAMYWLWEAYLGVLEGKDAGIALAEAQARAETFFRCVGAKASPDSQRIETCLLEADPDYKWSK
jgi:multiple sugar transport system substrate-binding protein